MNGMAAKIRSRFRLLGLAYLVLFAALVLLGAGVALLGSPHPDEQLMRLQVSMSPRREPPAVTDSVRRLSTPAPNSGPVYAGGALVADPALIEPTAAGPLPRIAANGTMPMRAYAASAGDGTKPRIAIIISGFGISAKATAAALAGLPPQVTLAFAPYADDVQKWVSLARRQGHEVLLEVPMESFDFPDSDPGSHTLRAGAAEGANTERLEWALTRFTGYVGVTNLLGGRLLSDSDSLEPVLAYLARRGLLFFDNGVATRSAAPDVASGTGVAFAQATLTIDSIQTAMEIDHQLSELENQARAHGAASGSGFIFPITLERVAHWAAGLDGRGFVLVPASAIVNAKK
jgi:polysaccharide deacetylase 2 family uncharacterized protein YibQ